MSDGQLRCPKSTILFDLDGTILYTLPDLVQACNTALLAHGLAPCTADEVMSYLGFGIGALVDSCIHEPLSQKERDEVFQDFVDYYFAHCKDNTTPYPGVPEFLYSLKAQGLKLGVVSNKADEPTQTLIHSIFGNVFDIVIGQRQDIPKKPAADGILLAMDTLGSKPEECVYIGDSYVDAQTAKNAGIEYIICSWGYRTKEFLTNKGIENIVDSLYELEDEIRKANQQ